MDETPSTNTADHPLGVSGTRKASGDKWRAACELVLLFHGASPWDDTKRSEWDERMNLILGKPEDREHGEHGYHYKVGSIPCTNEATTKNLCNAMRAVLK